MRTPSSSLPSSFHPNPPTRSISALPLASPHPHTVLRSLPTPSAPPAPPPVPMSPPGPPPPQGPPPPEPPTPPEPPPGAPMPRRCPPIAPSASLPSAQLAREGRRAPAVFVESPPPRPLESVPSLAALLNAPRRPLLPPLNGEPRLPEVLMALDAELGRLARHLSALALALRLDDRGVAAVAAARLRRSAGAAIALVAEGGEALPAAPSALLRVHLRAAQRLLDDVPAELAPVELHRLQRWVAAPASLGGAGSNADLFELRGSGQPLGATVLSQLHLLQCQLEGAQLVGSSFREAFLDGCDLTGADLAESRWSGAVVMRGAAQGASFRGAHLDEVIFSDCDLRGADLRGGGADEEATRRVELGGEPGGQAARIRGADRRRAVGCSGGSSSAARSMWIRCDLRNTVWTRRQLRGAHFVGCRLDGALGLEELPALQQVRCQPPPAAELAELAALTLAPIAPRPLRRAA